MTEPLVSVIMPAFNAGQFIAEAVDSVIKQTFTGWELIIVNDGSTDDTQAIAERYVAGDARIRLVKQQNKKLSAARNTGIANAKGEWVAFLDADDFWVAGKLEKQLVAAGKYPAAGVVFSDGFTYYNNDVKTAQPYGTIAGYFAPADIYKLEYQGNYIPVLSVLVKKKELDTVGLQDEKLRACEDWDYWLRLALQGVGFYGMEEKLFYYRRHAANMSNDNSLMSLANATIFIKNFKPELLPAEDIKRVTGFINRTICSLIKPGKINEALFLNNGMYNITGSGLRKWGSFIMEKLGKQSYYPVRLIFKMDRILT
ncbi:glycosyltransferase [Mucilaginibacter sp.]|uniref:glycosyltransferase family 2 protein n=1 Tax=Mucilaginibacter sp. TaxID=1882438 RepID=UPI0025EF8590|nr:glycosyltransferase [Mucilaginibacter sp.]